ncbi:MAG: thioesterase family protein [Burkholderiaceae bacterium]
MSEVRPELLPAAVVRTTHYPIDVQFGDCDPAGIVFFPNFSRWMDASSAFFFRSCGLPPWSEMTELPGSVGAPLLEIHTKFIKSATYGETLEVRTRIEAWRAKVFIQHHRVQRGDELICEGRETRAFCVRDGEGRLRAVPIPDFIRAACA